MENYTQRISAGGFVIHHDKILLVRYPHADGSFLVAPGGGLNDGETLRDAVKREVFEETGIRVEPQVPVMIENARSSRFQMLKIWYRCRYIEGVITATAESQLEGILSADWYTDEQLVSETVFPEIIQRLKIDGLLNFEANIIENGVHYANF